MSRDYKVFLEDIQESISKIQAYTANLSFAELKLDNKTLDAVVRNLEIIGEAVKNIPENIRIQYASIEWKKISGLRDMLIHEYFGIDAAIIWDIIQNKLPALQKELKILLPD